VNRIQVYSQEGQLLYATASGGALAAGIKYVYLDRHVIAEVGGSVQYDHTDGLGSPVPLTGATGGLISRTRYESYGVTAAGPTPAIGFTGHVSAADLGLVYMQQRYYDPVAGRFRWPNYRTHRASRSAPTRRLSRTCGRCSTTTCDATSVRRRQRAYQFTAPIPRRGW
jgi:RHS repeat-associated protein